MPRCRQPRHRPARRRQALRRRHRVRCGAIGTRTIAVATPPAATPLALAAFGARGVGFACNGLGIRRVGECLRIGRHRDPSRLVGAVDSAFVTIASATSAAAVATTARAAFALRIAAIGRLGQRSAVGERLHCGSGSGTGRGTGVGTLDVATGLGRRRARRIAIRPAAASRIATAFAAPATLCALFVTRLAARLVAHAALLAARRFDRFAPRHLVAGNPIGPLTAPRTAFGASAFRAAVTTVATLTPIGALAALAVSATFPATFAPPIPPAASTASTSAFATFTRRCGDER